MSEQAQQYRIRLTFGKNDSLRFVGHLDLAKTWERVLRRARLPLVYSQGFNPQPKMQLASALPLGISSNCEMLDIWLLEPVPLETLPQLLNSVSPPGLATHHAEDVPLKSPALQTVLHSAEYTIQLDEVGEKALQERVQALLASDVLLRERRGKEYDLRPLVLGLRSQGAGMLWAHLSLGEQGTARPDELLDAMGLSAHMIRCHREVLHVNGIAG